MVTEKDADSAAIDALEKLVKEKVAERCKRGESGLRALEKVFRFFDTDETGARACMGAPARVGVSRSGGTGMLTVDEFGRALERLGVPLERRLGQSLFARYDKDGRCGVLLPTKTASHARARSGAVAWGEFSTALYAGEVAAK